MKKYLAFIFCLFTLVSFVFLIVKIFLFDYSRSRNSDFADFDQLVGDFKSPTLTLTSFTG